LFLVRKQCERASIQIEERIADDLPQLSLDPGRLKQVFLNLFSNAIDAMPEGGTLTVAAELHDLKARVIIADSGVGIEPEKVPLVFEPFFTSKGQGTGLGLAISHNIISDHGGTIKVESQSGHGSVFTIELPLPQRAS
jgi:signal transduction histidine kinase